MEKQKERRIDLDRRKISYDLCIPERRKGDDRRIVKGHSKNHSRKKMA